MDAIAKVRGVRPTVDGDEQAEVVRLLGDPASYGAGVRNVERIDTHISHIFLAGDEAFKLKRAVKLPFVDFSQVEDRRAFCEKEHRLNHRIAPQLYLGVMPVSRRPDGTLHLGEGGEAVDWLVHMRRFPKGALFSDLVAAGKLKPTLLLDLAERLAKFHEACTRHKGYGDAAATRRTVDVLNRSLTRFAGRFLDGDKVERWRRLASSMIDRHAAHLDARDAGGFVRRCHGDLHLENIVLFKARALPFDAVEFSDEIGRTDVLYDLAFPVMDLIRFGERRLANGLMNRYLSATRDYGGLAAWSLFLSLRAAVRAVVLGWRDDAAEKALSGLFLDLAIELAETPEPRLIAIGGPSGSGKSTVAEALAPLVAPSAGAVLISSDVIRKRLAGVRPEEILDEEHYSPEVNEQVYRRLHEDCETALRAGQVVIADATFIRPPYRYNIGAVAEHVGVPFAPVWLDVPKGEMRTRITARPKGPSDATVAVLEGQLAKDIGDISWTRIKAGGGLEATVERARAALGGKR